MRHGRSTRLAVVAVILVCVFAVAPACAFAASSVYAPCGISTWSPAGNASTGRTRMYVKWGPEGEHAGAFWASNTGGTAFYWSSKVGVWRKVSRNTFFSYYGALTPSCEITWHWDYPKHGARYRTVTKIRAATWAN